MKLLTICPNHLSLTPIQYSLTGLFSVFKLISASGPLFVSCSLYLNLLSYHWGLCSNANSSDRVFLQSYLKYPSFSTLLSLPWFFFFFLPRFIFNQRTWCTIWNYIIYSHFCLLSDFPIKRKRLAFFIISIHSSKLCLLKE